MMNNCYNYPVSVNGYLVLNNGYHYQAQKENDKKVIFFTAEGRNKRLYVKILGLYDGRRRYNAEKYLYKYRIIVQKIANYLKDNDYLWDYERQCPLLEK